MGKCSFSRERISIQRHICKYDRCLFGRPSNKDMYKTHLFSVNISGLAKRTAGPMGQRSKTTAKAGFSVFIKTTR